MAEFNSEYVKNLPDIYKKSETSNNYKILNIVQGSAAELKEDTEKVYNSLDIEQATGKTLDLYGQMLGQARGFATDQQYRVMIKARIMRNIMNGDYNSLMKAACMMFNCDSSEFYIEESEKPATIDVITLPYRVLNYIGLSVDQTIELIKVLMPVGVEVGSVSLAGTFEFGSTDDEYDENKGFAISEADQSIGGYFGYIGSGSDKPLPI